MEAKFNGKSLSKGSRNGIGKFSDYGRIRRVANFPKKNFPLVFDAVSFREKTKLGLIPSCCRGPKLIFQSVVKTWSN